MQKTTGIQDRWNLFTYPELAILQESLNIAQTIPGYSNVRSMLLDQVNKELLVRNAQIRLGIDSLSND